MLRCLQRFFVEAQVVKNPNT